MGHAPGAHDGHDRPRRAPAARPAPPPPTLVPEASAATAATASMTVELVLARPADESAARGVGDLARRWRYLPDRNPFDSGLHGTSAMR